MHVDDGQGVHNCPALYQQLVTVLEQRYGPLTHNASTKSYLGQAITVHSSGRVSYSMEGYIRRLCSEHRLLTVSHTPLMQPYSSHHQILPRLILYNIRNSWVASYIALKPDMTSAKKLYTFLLNVFHIHLSFLIKKTPWYTFLSDEYPLFLVLLISEEF